MPPRSGPKSRPWPAPAPCSAPHGGRLPAQLAGGGHAEGAAPPSPLFPHRRAGCRAQRAAPGRHMRRLRAAFVRGGAARRGRPSPALHVPAARGGKARPFGGCTVTARPGRRAASKHAAGWERPGGARGVAGPGAKRDPPPPLPPPSAPVPSGAGRAGASLPAALRQTDPRARPPPSPSLPRSAAAPALQPARPGPAQPPYPPAQPADHLLLGLPEVLQRGHLLRGHHEVLHARPGSGPARGGGGGEHEGRRAAGEHASAGPAVRLRLWPCACLLKAGNSWASAALPPSRPPASLPPSLRRRRLRQPPAHVNKGRFAAAPAPPCRTEEQRRPAVPLMDGPARALR